MVSDNLELMIAKNREQAKTIKVGENELRNV